MKKKYSHFWLEVEDKTVFWSLKEILFMNSMSFSLKMQPPSIINGLLI